MNSSGVIKNLISKMPRSKEELRIVAGFGEPKAKKYGDDILKIVDNYSMMCKNLSFYDKLCIQIRYYMVCF